MKKSAIRLEQSDFERRWKSRFENFARTHHDDARIAGWTPTGLETRLRCFKRVSRGVRPGGTWLDVGCGAGTYSRFLASQGVHVVGLDFSFPTIQRARDRSQGDVAWGVANVNQLPVRPGSFDGILCFGVFQALAESGSAVRELAAAAKPGGELWVDALNAWCLPNWIERWRLARQRRPAHLRYEFPGVVKRAMAEQGLTDIRIHWVPILPERFQRLQWLFETKLAAWALRRLPGLGALLCHSFIATGVRNK